jgi:hypothetical protein
VLGYNSLRHRELMLVCAASGVGFASRAPQLS